MNRDEANALLGEYIRAINDDPTLRAVEIRTKIIDAMCQDEVMVAVVERIKRINKSFMDIKADMERGENNG